MSAAAPGAGRLRGLAVGAGCVALVLVFFLALFPWERLRGPLERAASGAVGAEVRVGELAGGPRGLHLARVRVRRPGGAAFELGAVRVRPALSLAWLRGVPALAVDVRAWGAHAAGTALLDPAAPGFDGRVEGLDPSALPPGLLEGDPPWIGPADADLDLVLGAAGPRGALAFRGADGALALPGLPFALPYDRVEGAVDFTDEGTRLEGLDLEGPMVSAAAEGTLGPGDPMRAPLALDLVVRRADPNVRGLLGQLGVRLGPDGRAAVRIEGSLARPVVTARAARTGG